MIMQMQNINSLSVLQVSVGYTLLVNLCFIFAQSSFLDLATQSFLSLKDLKRSIHVEKVNE